MKLAPQQTPDELVYGPDGTVYMLNEGTPSYVNNLLDYESAFSPGSPEVKSVNQSYHDTLNASVKIQDELANTYSAAPEIPKNNSNLIRFGLILVGGFLIYKIIKKGK